MRKGVRIRHKVMAALIGLALAAPATAEVRETWFDAAINGRDAGLSILILTTSDDQRWIRIIDLRQLQLPVPPGPLLVHAGEVFVPLGAIPPHAFDPSGTRIDFGYSDGGSGETATSSAQAPGAPSAPAPMGQPSSTPGSAAKVPAPPAVPAPAPPRPSPNPGFPPPAPIPAPAPTAATTSTAAPAMPEPMSAPPGTGSQAREAWLMAARNHLDTRLSVLVVTTGDGRRWIRVSDLRLLGIDEPTGERLQHAGETFVPLQALSVQADVDPIAQRLHLIDAKAPIPEAALIVDMIVNGQALPEPQPMDILDGQPWLSAETLAAANLLAPPGVADAEGRVPVAALAGPHYVMDADQTRLELTAPPERFPLQHIDGRYGIVRRRDVPPLTPGVPALTLGYDLAASRPAMGPSTRSALLDVAFGVGRGSCGSQHLWRSKEGPTRLETSCAFDWPERRLSLLVGDAATRSWGQGGAVRYGGVRIGTNFSLQPYLLTQPLLGISGSARLPSLLEIWTDQQLMLKTGIAPGQFLVEGFPMLTGRGDFTAVVTDALGRQTVVTAPFYADPLLLSPGLVDWAIEAGKPRLGTGTNSDEYAGNLFQAGFRRGMAPWWTLYGQATWQDDLRLAGLGQYLRLGNLGVAEMAVSWSELDGVGGKGWTLGYTYAGRRLALGLRERRQDSNYVDPAWPDPHTAPRRESTANFSLRVGPASLSAGGVLLEDAKGEKRTLLRAGLTWPVGRSQLSLTGRRQLRPERTNQWSLYWSVPLDWGSLAAWVDENGSGPMPGASLRRSPPVGPGLGYGMSWQDRPNGGDLARADLDWRTSLFDTGFHVMHDRYGETYAANVGGALILSANGLDAGRSAELDGSYALVRLPAEGVRIYRDHQVVATTGPDGSAVIPGLRPFEVNTLEVAVSDMPIEMQLERASLEVVPGRRQLVRADFGASARRPVQARVLQPDGQPVPAGSLARLRPSGDTFPLGENGLMYLEVDPAASSVEFEWDGAVQCRLAVSALPEDMEASLPTLTCQQGARP